MRRFLVLSIQTALFTITCCLLSQYMSKNSSLLIDRPWYHAAKHKVLRLGNNAEEQYTQPPPEMPETATPRRDCICSKIYDPVCASNNESYFNLCFLECKVPKSENISVIHQGNCIPFRR